MQQARDRKQQHWERKSDWVQGGSSSRNHANSLSGIPCKGIPEAEVATSLDLGRGDRRVLHANSPEISDLPEENFAKLKEESASAVSAAGHGGPEGSAVRRKYE